MSMALRSGAFQLPMVFVVGCPRSGTSWISEALAQSPRVALTQDAVILDIFLGPWWDRIHPDGEFLAPKQGPVGKLWLDVLERLFVLRRPGWYGEWRDILMRYFDERLPFILYQSGFSKRGTPLSDGREHLVSYEKLVELIEQVEDKVSHWPHDAKAAWVADMIFIHYSASHKVSGGEPLLVDKSPGHLFSGEFLLTHFPGAKIIEAVRDGREVCADMDAHSTWMPEDREAQIFLWKRFTEAGRELAENPSFKDRILTVRFEDMQHQPEAEIEKIYGFVGLKVPEGDSSTLAQSMGSHDAPPESAWRQHFSDEDTQHFRSEAGEMFERLGYTW